MIQQENALRGTGLGQRLQERVDIGQLRVGNNLGSVRGHLPCRLPEVADERGEWNRIRPHPRSG